MLVDIPIENAGPPQLSDQYYQARKVYVLVCGLLLTCVLVGLGLPEDGRVMPYSSIVLKNPSALPLIFLTLLIYSAYRITIEWNQCDERRRAMKVSRIDFLVSHALGLFSVAAYLIDQALEVGLGELAVAYAPEGIFVTLWIVVCFESPLLLRAAFEQLGGGARGQGSSGWVSRVDASMAPIFVAIVCVTLLGLTAVLLLDSLSNLASSSWYDLIRNLGFAAVTLVALFLPRRMRDYAIPAVLLSLTGKHYPLSKDSSQNS
ncbi:hypothetical protein [Petrachloros mirabilis]